MTNTNENTIENVIAMQCGFRPDKYYSATQNQEYFNLHTRHIDVQIR